MTTPPCRIGCGAYAASFVGPVAGTLIGSGIEGSAVVVEDFDDSCAKTLMTETRMQQAIDSGLFMTRILAGCSWQASAFSDDMAH